MLVKTQAIILLEAGVASPYCLNVISQYSLYSVGTVILCCIVHVFTDPTHLYVHIHVCLDVYMYICRCEIENLEDVSLQVTESFNETAKRAEHYGYVRYMYMYMCVLCCGVCVCVHVRAHACACVCMCVFVMPGYSTCTCTYIHVHVACTHPLVYTPLHNPNWHMPLHVAGAHTHN